MQKGDVGLPTLMRLAHAGGRGGNPSLADKQDFASDEEVLDAALWGSPVLKATIQEITKLLRKSRGRKKVIVFTHLLRTAAYINRILKFVGVETLLLTTQMKPEDRSREVA